MHMSFDPNTPAQAEITFDQFLKLDIRMGTILSVEDIPKARNPSYKLMIDFGSAIGIKKSAAQITALYKKDELIGRQVAAVVNFAPRQVATVMSEVLTLGFANETGQISLIGTDTPVPNGSRLA